LRCSRPFIWASTFALRLRVVEAVLGHDLRHDIVCRVSAVVSGLVGAEFEAALFI
jgi:hypothetical protein